MPLYLLRKDASAARFQQELQDYPRQFPFRARRTAKGRILDSEITLIRCPRKPENHLTSPTWLRRWRESCERNPVARRKSAHRKAVVPMKECHLSARAFHRRPSPGTHPAADPSHSVERCRKRPIFPLPPMKTPCLREYRTPMATPS
jgi:hypothetical protein